MNSSRYDFFYQFNNQSRIKNTKTELPKLIDKNMFIPLLIPVPCLLFYGVFLGVVVNKAVYNSIPYFIFMIKMIIFFASCSVINAHYSSSPIYTERVSQKRCVSNRVKVDMSLKRLESVNEKRLCREMPFV